MSSFGCNTRSPWARAQTPVPAPTPTPTPTPAPTPTPFGRRPAGCAFTAPRHSGASTTAKLRRTAVWASTKKHAKREREYSTYLAQRVQELSEQLEDALVAAARDADRLVDKEAELSALRAENAKLRYNLKMKKV